MMEEIMIFFREMFPLYVLFTPTAVVSISVLLVMVMTTPYDNEAARYKEYKICLLGMGYPSVRSNIYDTLF